MSESQVITKRNQLVKKIVKEHFAMTLHTDRNINYLWYMYNNGTKKGYYKPFILLFELNLFVALNIITKDERDSLLDMLKSEDSDNFYLGLLAIENLRKQRVKIHGEYKGSLPDVSNDFAEVINKYPVVVVDHSYYNKH